MSSFLPTIIWRHKKENLKKCTLWGLEKDPSFYFLKNLTDLPLNISLDHYILLKVGSPPLTTEDQHFGLFLIDATWRYAETMEKRLPQMPKRSLPTHFRTAYPRYQTHCPDPLTGLASIEALFLAHLILKKPTRGLLDHYYWKETFLRLNNLEEKIKSQSDLKLSERNSTLF